ncbi:MAG: serine hydrolase, partial [Rubrivivax sp.]|nr:serine hydrolase [Rubrivivax sp.]
EEPVTDYLLALAGSAYDGVRIKDILQMSSGAGWNEDYSDPDSDINRFAAVSATGGAMSDFVPTLKREREPGTFNHYNSMDTQVLGMVLKAATGRTIADYMQEKLWHPLGMESSGHWLVDDTGMEMAYACLNATARDYAKIGELFRNVLSGSKEAGEGFKDFVRGIAQQMLSLITARWGEKLANSLFGPNAGTNGASANGGQGFNWGAFLQSIFASVNHTGGVIGAAGSTMRAVSPLVFAGAQVLHSGGLVTEGQRSLGLRPTEAAVIAEVGEEMLTEDNPRHIKNFKGGNGVVVQSSITVNGASGTEQQQLAEAERLQQMMRATVEQWAGEQRRQGGILAGVRRG